MIFWLRFCFNSSASRCKPEVQRWVYRRYVSILASAYMYIHLPRQYFFVFVVAYDEFHSQFALTALVVRTLRGLSHIHIFVGQLWQCGYQYISSHSIIIKNWLLKLFTKKLNINVSRQKAVKILGVCSMNSLWWGDMYCTSTYESTKSNARNHCQFSLPILLQNLLFIH